MSNIHDFFLLLLLLLSLATFLFFRATAIKTRPTKPRLPPSPRALPIIGHLHLLGRLPHQSLHKLSLRYGPLLHLSLGSKPCLLVSSPEVAKHFLKTHESSFLNRPTRLNIHYLTYGSADFTFAPYGPYWKFLKKLCMTELLGGRTLDLHLPVRQEEMRLFIQRIHRNAVAAAAVNVGAELLRLMNNIISRMTLGRRWSENEEEGEGVCRLVEEMCELAGKVNVADMIWFCKDLDLQGFGKRVRDVRNRYDVVMERIMKEHEERRRRKGDGGEDDVGDLLDVLLDISEDESSAIRLTRENIKAFVMNLFGAGTDTSAITTEWALSELINNPNAMAKARQEIDSLLGKTRIIQESDIPNLPYLQATVKETLRLHPTAPLLLREATEACTINGYDVPEKTRLLVNVWAIGRDADHWEDPLEFRPERFLSGDAGTESYGVLAFGSGRRSCPGAALALRVIPAAVGAMVQWFEWRVEGGGCAVEMEEGAGISLPRARPLVLIPVPRLDPFPFIS